MKSGKPTAYIQNTMYSLFASNKFRYPLLLSLVCLISLTLTAQDITLEAKRMQKTDQGSAIELPLLRHLFLKVKINPPYNQNITDYAGLPVHILSYNNELIAEGMLDQNGQVEFNELIKVSLDRVHIYSVVTGDKITVENPNGAVVGFLISPLDKLKDI